MSMAVTAPTIFDLPEGIVTKQEKTTDMSDTERREFADRIRALSDEELGIVIDNIPIEMCMQRIQNELNRYSMLEQRIAETMNLFNITGA